MRRRILLLSFLFLSLDQLTKAAALKYLSTVATVAVIPGIFHLTLVRNTGIAFGLLKGYALPVMVLTPLILFGLLWLNLGKGREAPGPRTVWAIGMILGGAAGNLLDRIRWGSVTDFFDFRIWPVFNVADACITLGALWMAWSLLRRKA